MAPWQLVEAAAKGSKSRPRGVSNQGVKLGAICMVLAVLPHPGHAFVNENEPHRRHASLDQAQTAVDRLDLTASVIEQGANEEGVVTVQYTRSFGSHQLAFATPLVDTELGGDLYLNAGDLVLEYAWSPRKQISAGPWVPSDYGTGIQISVPTGSVANGTGSGSVILAPRLGAVFHVGHGWAIAPTIEYQYAFEYENDAEQIRGIAAASQFVYIGPQGFWVNLTPVYIHDLNSQQGALGGGIILGKLLTSHFAISIEYLREPVYGDPEQDKGFNYANVWQLGFLFPLHYK